MTILTGFLLGLSTLLFIGPVLFYLLKSSMESGVKAGFAVAIGIIVGDIICVVLALYGDKSFFENDTFKFWLALIGGIILLAIGLKYLIRPNINTQIDGKIKKKSFGVYFLNGFLINFINPFVFAVWLGFTTYNQSMYSGKETMISLIVTLITIFSTDVLKALYANKIQHVIKPEKLTKVFRVFGVIMIVFSLRLLLYPFFNVG
jgi:threonine/homoserine/homoserine lactone efflux protein